MRYILNNVDSAVMRAPGRYNYSPLSREQAREWARGGCFLSTVAYEQTATALEHLLGQEVMVNAMTIQMEPGDEALVFRLRLPSGHPRIHPADKGGLVKAVHEGHFEVGLLRRLDNSSSDPGNDTREVKYASP